MTTIVPYGSLNLAGLNGSPQAYVQIVAPKVKSISGVATDTFAAVGVGSWGPLNTFVTVGDYDGVRVNVGDVQNRKADIATALAVAIELGVTRLGFVRVSDGTDAAATKVHQISATTAVTFTAKYTGTRGNKIKYAFYNGSAAGTFQCRIFVAGEESEIYDNLPSGSGCWAALVDGINNGNRAYAVNGAPSRLVRATVGTSNSSPTADGAEVALTGGSDGATGITDAMLVGTVSPATGMYALEGQDVAVMVVLDCTTTSLWPTINNFAAKQGVYTFVSGAAGETAATAMTNRAATAFDDYWTKVLVGDFCYWNDNFNGVLRLVAPTVFAAARLANLSPHLSGLNKEIPTVVGTQKTGEPGSGKLGRYSEAELAALRGAGIDVITSPLPKSKTQYGLRIGCNAYSKPGMKGDNHPRMTGFLAKSLAASIGDYIGEPITPDLMRAVEASVRNFTGVLERQGMIVRANVQCDENNNPFSRTSQGILQCDVAVTYAAITTTFILNLEGGQTVVTVAPATNNQ